MTRMKLIITWSIVIALTMVVTTTALIMTTGSLNTTYAKPKKAETVTTNTPTITPSANQPPELQITSEQKAAMCKPNDTSINTTESKVCGIPATTSNNATTTQQP